MRLSPRVLSCLLCVVSGCGRFGFDSLGIAATGSSPNGTSEADGDGSATGNGEIGDGSSVGANADAAASSMPLGDSDASTGNTSMADGSTSSLFGCVAATEHDAPLPVHRYSFDGTGTQASDGAGSAHGTVLGGASLDGSGSLSLDGVDDYVDLPNGLISPLSAVTIMAWVTWNSGPQRQTVFDFGATQGGENVAGTPSSRIAVRASSPGTGLSAHVLSQGSSTDLSTGQVLSIGVSRQLVLEVDPQGDTMALYFDGALLGSRSLSLNALTDIQDINAWLGRSQDTSDTFFRGRLDELRIYDRVLGPCAVLAAFHAGPDQTTFPRCAKPDASCTFSAFGTLGAWSCTNALSWSAARDACAAAGMFLPVIDDSSENSALQSAMSSSSMWLGYTDQGSEGTFVWCGASSTYENWRSGQPDQNGDEDCAAREPNVATWIDESCALTKPFACAP